MASYRQLPGVFRRLHPRFKTPWLSLVVFAGIAPILLILPGDVTFVGTLYAFGATLSFTVAHASLVRLRMHRRAASRCATRARPNLQIGGIAWPVFAVVGGIAHLHLLPRDPPPEPDHALGRARLARVRPVGYTIYRRRFVHAPLTEIVRAPALVLGPSLTVEYRTIVVPVVRSAESEEALVAAARLASERGSRIAVLARDRDAARPAARRARSRRGGGGRRRAARRRRGAGRALRRAGRARASCAHAPPARRSSQEAMARTRRADRARRAAQAARGVESKAVFGRTVDYVLKTSPSRVMVAAGAGGRHEEARPCAMSRRPRRPRRRDAGRHGRRRRQRARGRVRLRRRASFARAGASTGSTL